MTNVIDLTARRGRRPPEEAATRGAQQKATRKKEADALLDRLHRTARLDAADRVALVKNLGRSVIQLETENRKEAAKKILGTEYWGKRKRYIRFPNDTSKKSVRYAASGSAFKGIIERLINEKTQRYLDHEHATIETVYEVLKGTSFQRSTRFQPVDRQEIAVSARDVGLLVRTMEKISAKLSEEGNLVDYFNLISRYPIRPGDYRPPWLRLNPELPPNTVHDWWERFFLEDEMLTWLPWWAPKCVIGHLYVPFQCGRVKLPEEAVTQLKEKCRGEISNNSWHSDYLWEVEEFFTPEQSEQHRAYHRLPIWLAALPPSTKPILCLYISFDALLDDFQIGQALSSDSYYEYTEASRPHFVENVGLRMSDDHAYFRGDDQYNNEWDTVYLCPRDGGVNAIGDRIDPDEPHFISDTSAADGEDDLPTWLGQYPVQRIFRLNGESTEAIAFALAPRAFTEDTAFQKFPWSGESHAGRAVFRPAFSDSEFKLTELRENTIAAFLLRNLAYARTTIFDALKNDALAKDSVARELVERGSLETQDAFDARYGK